MLRNLLITFYASLAMVTMTSAETYYWVGGSGNWSDTSHWAITSGGDVLHGVIPGPMDDVIFDEASFIGVDTVTIDVASASCRDMIWTNTIFFPTLANLPAASLLVYGDLRLTRQMNFAFAGTTSFRGEGNHIVETFGHNLGNNVYFDDVDGRWEVNGAVRLTNALFIRKGRVLFDNTIECNYLHIIPTDIADNCEVSFSDNITIRNGNSNTLESMKINADLVNLDFNPNTLIEFLGVNTTLRIVGVQRSLNLPAINFSNPTGNQRVFADNTSNHQFEAITFGANGRIDVSSDIGRLTLVGGSTYLLGANQNFDIDELEADGDCSNPIYLLSTAIGNRASVSTANVLNAAFLNIRDVEVAGGSFQVSNAKDLGNTAGWNMTDIGSQDLFWVGGTGSWQDQTNWSYTSGGAGGACIPTPIDDVYFDENSFIGVGDVVALGAGFSYCRNMIWTNVTGMPSLTLEGQALNVSGSFTLDTGMNLIANGVLRFDAFGGNHTITSSGHDLGRDVRLETIGGTYSLLDELTIRGRLLHVHGNLVSNGHTMNLVEYSSNYGTVRGLDISNSQVNLAAIPGKAAAWQIGSNGYTLASTNSTINATSGISLIHRGTGSLQFDRVLFSSTGNIYAYNGVDARFSYVSMASSSFVFSNNQFDTLVLAQSQSYEFSSGSIQTIGRLESIGRCDGPINIQAQTVGSEAIFFTDFDISEVRNTLVKDIHVQGTGAIRNILGVDNGNAVGWNIASDVGRNLYWVDNGGNWNDPAHWSLTSGGLGGECIPTSADNVFFDENSFDQAGQVVSGGNIFFRDMNWIGVTNTPSVSFSNAFTYGSIELVDDMNINAWTWISLFGQTNNNVLDTKNKQFTHLVLNGLGDWTLTSPINAAGQFFIYNGGLSTNDQDIRTERIRIWERRNLNIDLSSSTIDLFGNGASTPQFAQYQSDAAILNFNPGTSTINIEHPNGYTLIGSNEVSLHNLNFLPTTGSSRMDVRTTDRIDYHKVVFNNNGVMLREHRIDSLIFAPGKTYTLQSNRTQIVNDHLEITGSPCGPTILKASSLGSPATIQKINGIVNGDYIRMRDQIGEGESFSAGQHSINVGNSNAGWIFEEITEDNPERGILGDDQILCDGSSIRLAPFTNAQDLTFEWSTGSTERLESFSDPGTYWVDLTFAEGCGLRDSIVLLPQVYSNTDIGADSTLCAGDEHVLDASIEGGLYRWQDGSTDESFIVSEAGQYFVHVEYLGCPNSDTINILFDTPPEPNLGVDRIACENEIVGLTPNTPYDDILWNDDLLSSEDTLFVNESGVYTVEVVAGVCVRRDSVEISFFDLEDYLGPDTAICAGDKVKIEYIDDGSAAYEWSTGDTGSAIEVSTEGIYSLKLTQGICEIIDEIEVSIKPIPTLSIDKEVYVCEGESIQLEPTTNGDNFEWSTDESSQNITVSEEGTYQVIAYLDGCTNNDYTTVFVDELPMFDLGGDTTICQQLPLGINVSFAGATYQWNDGTQVPMRIISETGNYAVTITNGVCEVEQEINIQAYECKEFQVYAPNIFSPNGDGQNDEFLPFFDQSLDVSAYQLTIYDRWGGIVFETDDLEDGWDGTANGRPLHRGTYIYIMQFSYTDELTSDKATINGDVFLTR